MLIKHLIFGREHGYQLLMISISIIFLIAFLSQHKKSPFLVFFFFQVDVIFLILWNIADGEVLNIFVNHMVSFIPALCWN